MSQWRIFLRGLAAWNQQEFDTADGLWARLDHQRRPGRMAIALSAARHEKIRRMHDAGEDVALPWNSQLDDSLVRNATLVRRIRFERLALEQARRRTSEPEEAPELADSIGPRRLKWLAEFAQEYRDIEPKLVRNLEDIALCRAFKSGYHDIFELAAGTLHGPPEDPQNLLLRREYEEEEGDLDSLAPFFHSVLANEQLSLPLRQALVAEFCFTRAKDQLQLYYPAFMGKVAALRFYTHSTACYPQHAEAYRKQAEVLKELIDEAPNKKECEPWLEVMLEAMRLWSEEFPEEVEPRLWLMEHYLEADETQLAEPHAEWLAACRHDDPRVRCTPWRWALLEAMRLCRRKAWLAQVPERLERAEQLWPDWLPKTWLSYLQAALDLRTGRQETYEQRRQELRKQHGQVADACMMLGAAQRMRVPAADLKPLREAVEQQLASVSGISDDDLLELFDFAWDIQRTSLVYPAYRSHGKRFLEEFISRLSKSPSMAGEYLRNDRLQSVLHLATVHALLAQKGVVRKWMLTKAAASSVACSCALMAGRNAGRFWLDVEMGDRLLRQVEEAAGKETDEFYRFWYQDVAAAFAKTQASRRLSPDLVRHFADAPPEMDRFVDELRKLYKAGLMDGLDPSIFTEL